MRLFNGLLPTALMAALMVAQTAMAQKPARPDGPLALAIKEAAAQDVTDAYSYIRQIKVDAEDEVVNQIERFDPIAAGEGDEESEERGTWTLLAVDDREPTEEDLADYDSDAEATAGSDNPFALYRKILGDLKIEDAVLLEETATRAEYSLSTIDHALLEEEQKDLSEALDARLIVDKTGPRPFVSSYRVYAPEPFRKAMVAKINAFETAFSFMRHDETGDILPQSVRVHLSVEALLFIDVDADTTITFRDYQYRGGDR